MTGRHQQKFLLQRPRVETSASETVVKWEAGAHTTRRKSGFDRRAASTQRYVLTANGYLTKCPQVHSGYTEHYLKCLVTSSAVSLLTSFLKLTGSRGSEYTSSVTRNVERPTGRRSRSLLLSHFHPFYLEKIINLFLGTWLLWKAASQCWFLAQKTREPHTRELYATALSAPASKP